MAAKVRARFIFSIFTPLFIPGTFAQRASPLSCTYDHFVFCP